MSIIDGARILELRMRKEWGQNDLAQAAVVDTSVISRLERGIQTDFQLSVIVAIAKVLETSVDSLLTEAYQPETGDIAVELQEVITQLSQHPKFTQRQAAGILRGYLSTLKENFDSGENP